MSFFIRNKSNKLTTPGSTGKNGFKEKQRNKDFKKRPSFNKSKSSENSFNRKRKGPGSDGVKKPKFDRRNEEIESEESDIEDEKKGEDEDVNFGDSSSDLETAQEKKVRLAKLYLEEIAKEEERRRDDEEIDDDLIQDKISSRLRDDVLESEGRLRREIALKTKPDYSNVSLLTCPKYLKRSVTCLCISPDSNHIYSGDKDGHLIKWSVKEKKKIGMVKRKKTLSKSKLRKLKHQGAKVNKEPDDPNSVHSSSIRAIAISSDGKFLATGDLDNKIVIWNPDDLKKIHVFTGHRGSINGLTFRKKTNMLYSASEDRSVRIWSLEEMGYVETLFGHQDSVTSVDALSRERAISSGGRDGSIRVWKIVEESQLVYNGHPTGSVDCVKLINEEAFFSSGDDGVLSLWNVNRKKPMCSFNSAHGLFPVPEGAEEGTLPTSRWISAIATMVNSDLVASGSSDGHLKFWRCGEKLKFLEQTAFVEIPGWINSLEFSPDGNFIVVGTGKEHRLGRWFNDIKEAKHGIYIVPLIQS